MVLRYKDNANHSSMGVVDKDKNSTSGHFRGNIFSHALLVVCFPHVIVYSLIQLSFNV